MTLPNDDVINYLDSRFILAHSNIEKEEHVGLSHGYSPSQSCVGTTNGAGGRNVQFLILSADETVLHALPGFWHAEDLVPELQLAFEINRLYLDENKTDEQKGKMFSMLHKTHMRRYGPAAKRRGQWQGFDRWVEMKRVQFEERDTFRKTASGELELKSVPEVIHDRMLQRRFKKLADFDLEKFVDYGRSFYDNNRGEKGKTFSKAAKETRKREARMQKEREEAAIEAAKVAAKQKRADRKAKKNKKTSSKTWRQTR